MLKSTKDLINIVKKKASEHNSYDEAQKLLQQGADVTTTTKKGSMIDSVIAEEKRLRQTIPWKADNCLRLIQILEKGASDRLSAQVFSANGGDLEGMYTLVHLHASCYQSTTYGSLGLLGALLKQDKVPIRLDVVQFLIESDPNTKFSLTTADTEAQTCLSRAKKNPKCPRDVIHYIQRQLDGILNQIPITQPQIDPNEVITWIRRGADIEAIDEKRNTALSNAVITNNLALADALVSAGSNIAHENGDRLTPLQIAKKATPKNPQLIALLEAQGVNVELKRLIEIKKSQLTIDEVHTVLANGANINATFTNKDSPLHLLISNKGKPEMVAAFVNDFNADLSAMNTNGHRPIETYILLDEDPFVYLLTLFKLPKVTLDLFHNPRLNKTLLQFAIDEQRVGAAKIIRDELNIRLWNCMARTNTKEDNNETIMKEFSQLIGCGAQINHQHEDKEYKWWTVLHLACKTSTKQVVQYIIKHLGADFTLQNHNGDYPISIAAEYGHLPIVEYLHSLPKSSVNVVNKDQQTVLHLATKNHHLLVVRYLVKWGADHQAQNNSKQTPLDIARANASKTKEEEMSDKKLIQFLEQLICPPVDDLGQQSSKAIKSSSDIDTCELGTPVVISDIQISTEDTDEALKKQIKGFLFGSPNNNLHDAAKTGALWMAKQAIGQGADIRHRKGNRTPYEVAQISMKEYSIKLSSPMLSLADRPRIQTMADGCQQIADMIRQIAQTKVVEAIDQSNAGLVVAYHLAGAPLTDKLLYRACSVSDNVEIVDYLINQSMDIYQVMINDSSSNCPYRIAKKKKFSKVATYLKYRLSLECTKAVKENNFEMVKKLVCSGASVDMQNTNNLDEALQHQNADLIQFLCQNGAKMPSEWLSEKTMQLKSTFSKQLKPEIALCINQSLINRRLRLAAASGDFKSVIQCQHLGADINSTNCHGSTALLCTIQHGNYFRIVHALVSCGASMLHSNDDEPMSLIDIAKTRNYKKITSYLSHELNIQFMSAILNNDRGSAEKFAQLGAEFNYQDEQKRTALHYAVQYHSVDLVTWLCECGSTPTICDINGDYPIIQATEKGDYAMVELFVTKYPATKRQTNKAGLTALQIAQKLKFARIAELIETGKAVPQSSKHPDENNNKPKYDYETLAQAACNGHVKIIQEFIDERYESKEEKRRLCYELIQVAKTAKQFQIVDILEPYYNTKLRTQLASDMEIGSAVILGEHYKRILLGFLSALSGIIADSPVVLDPADPNTYRDLFSDLTANVAKRSQELQRVTSEQDVKKLINQDETNTKERLTKINEQLQQLLESKNSLEARIQDTDERLFKQQRLTALQRKELTKEKEVYAQQLATYECSIFLFQRQQEATLIRQKTINFIKANTNLIMFYRIIENQLDALFLSALAAQGGYLKTETTMKSSVTGTIVNMLPTKIPILNVASASIKAVLGPVLSKLNEKEQKKEWYNISTLGNVEELRRISSDTAGLVTLYYREQIQSIDPLQKIKGSNVFNDKMHWLKQVYDVRPESSEEIAVVMVAEYVTAWIIDGLKAGMDKIIPTEPLPQQLWLHVAKNDPTDQRKMTKITDVVGISAGQQRIPLKVRNYFGDEIRKQVQLRYLIGCVSVIGSDGSIYQYPTPTNACDNELEDLEVFGYVYVAPFSSDDKAFQSIVEGRKLDLAKRDKHGNILTRFADIIEYAQTYASQNDQHDGKSLITKETANQIAEVLREKKIFLDSKDVKEELRKARETIELSVDVLREEVQEKACFYQTSIDAAHEQIKQESKTNRETMKTDNEKRYDEAWNKLNEQFRDTEKRLEQLIAKLMNNIEKQIQEKTQEILKIAESAKTQSIQAVAQANQAIETSQRSVQKATEAAASTQKIVQWAEQRSLEFQSTLKTCETTFKQEAAAQKEFCEQTISDMRAKIELDFERARKAVNESAANAEESTQIGRELIATTRDVQQMAKNQLEVQKKETIKTIAEAKEVRQQSERAAAEAREAEKQAKRAADAGTAALDKMNSMYERVQKALERIEK
ncbi:unnamed protein product [Rotaria sp. Silwood2]|nr:unnamed protein product [Rotaria sp. Silwood2]